MRKQLKRNKRKIYYALYDKQMPVGDDVLECKAGYKKPVAFRASLSTGQSNAQENPFGTSVDYDRIICTTDMGRRSRKQHFYGLERSRYILMMVLLIRPVQIIRWPHIRWMECKVWRIAVKLIAQSVVEDMEQRQKTLQKSRGRIRVVI